MKPRTWIPSVCGALLLGTGAPAGPVPDAPPTAPATPAEPLGSTFLGADLGTRFAVYAPRASGVSVVGTFNQFNPSAHPLQPGGDGVWTATVAGAAPGDAYKYYSDDFDGQWVQDPWGKAFNDRDESLVVQDHYDWGDTGWKRPDKSELIIYEMHVKDFTRGDREAVSGANYAGVRDKIGYLTRLGVNCVELMPIQEWTGSEYRWGYNPACYFAPENSLSSHDGDGTARREVKEMIDALHRAGIAVVLDVVYNHTYWEAPAWRIDPAAYYDTSAPIPWGIKLDLTRPATHRMVRESLLYWLEEFHVDGFRFDFTPLIDSPALLALIADLRSAGYADRYFIFEEWDPRHNQAIQAFNVNAGGPAVSSWGTAYRETIWDLIRTGTSPDAETATGYFRSAGWTYPGEVITFAASHDDGTLTGHLDASPPAVKVATAHLLTALGIPMLWMGEEVLRHHLGNLVTSGESTDEANNVMDWDALRAAHAEVFDYFSALIRLRKAHPALRQGGTDSAGSGSFRRAADPGDGFIGYAYPDVPGDSDFVVLINFGADKRREITFPRTGTWHLMCNRGEARSDLPGLDTWEIREPTISIDMAATNAMIFMSARSNPQ